MIFYSKLLKNEIAIMYLVDFSKKELQKKFTQVAHAVSTYLTATAETSSLGEYYIAQITITNEKFTGFKPKRVSSFRDKDPVEMFQAEGNYVFHYYIDGIRFFSVAVQNTLPRMLQMYREDIKPPVGFISVDFKVCEALITKKFNKNFDAKKMISFLRSKI